MSRRALAKRRAARPAATPPVRLLPRETDTVEARIGGRAVTLTNLRKPFWPEEGIVKRDLLQYYFDVAPVLLPHLKDRAMVMKRYPGGAGAPFFFMKRAPSPRPEWIETCAIEHGSGRVIDFPMVQDVASLLWVVNLGCIDLNPWYARCDDTDRPDYLHFDLDPVKGAETVSRCRATRSPPARAGSTSTCRSCADRRRSRSGAWPRRSRRRWRSRARG